MSGKAPSPPFPLLRICLQAGSFQILAFSPSSSKSKHQCIHQLAACPAPYLVTKWHQSELGQSPTWSPQPHNCGLSQRAASYLPCCSGSLLAASAPTHTWPSAGPTVLPRHGSTPSRLSAWPPALCPMPSGGPVSSRAKMQIATSTPQPRTFLSIPQSWTLLGPTAWLPSSLPCPPPQSSRTCFLVA